MPRLSNIWTNPATRVVGDVPARDAPALREATLEVSGLLCSL